MGSVQAHACPGCGAAWSCGGGCPIWGYGGSGWASKHDHHLAAIAYVIDWFYYRDARINHDPGDEDRNA